MNEKILMLSKLSQASLQVILFLLAFLAISSYAYAQPNYLLWKIKAPDGTDVGHLFGEAHRVPKNKSKIPDVLQTIYNTSNYLVVESDISDPNFFVPFYPEGQNYYERLSAKTLDLLLHEKAKHSTKTKDQLLTSKPNLRPMVMHFIDQLTFASINNRDIEPPETVLGYMQQLSAQAVAKNRASLLSLEVPYFYEKAYVPCDKPENNDQLVYAAMEWGKSRLLAEYFLNAYDMLERGDLALFERINAIQRTHPGWQIYAKCSLWVRHAAWRDKLNQYVKEGKRNMLLIVGASHVFGEKNFREFMEAEGYSFIRILANPNAK
jgi:uncharacterized protein YbaP (TraB family)